ncbi:MAG: hypothetical protein RSA66_07240 [Muribaculaceae bacterium]
MNKLILLLSLILSVSLFSCDNDKKDDPTPPPPPTKANTLKYSIVDIGELFDMVDITVEYTKADGTVASEPMTAKTWTKEITGFKIPFKPTMKASFVKKAGFVAEEKTYMITIKFEHNYKLSNNDGYFNEFGGTTGVKGKKNIENYINNLVANPMVYTFDVPVKREPSKE